MSSTTVNERLQRSTSGDIRLLEGKIAIITGAASGIGRAAAHLFAEHGARVLAVDLPDHGLVDAHEDYDDIVGLEHDITGADAPEKIVDTAIATWGRLDILFNNAGVSGRANTVDMPDSHWDKVMSVNVTAQFRLARAAIPHLRESGAGRIINTASVMAQGTDYGLAAYCASKAGVAGLTRTIALEEGRHGITANYIEPGAVVTGMTTAMHQDENVAAIWAKKSPLKRLGQPIDIAKGALFLASDLGGFVTGHGLRVDGGLMLRV
ncbi:SDR family NAD(P)-dependent oxidoreductase [Emcibacter sp. SYSU 3D8]|uniref:SDR family NAD(P)-dependent oxidoreductase n=1 Tax=Emcibacter sp. SYSU 3D8 TaxID=3133969 RepID=UPI0031FF14DC